jgi:hypothetical protein
LPDNNAVLDNGRTDRYGSTIWDFDWSDVLRATSTIITALASGAIEVRPCMTVEEAKVSVAKLPRDSYLLGGEEMGESIPGFDLGNSPFEYMAREVVEGGGPGRRERCRNEVGVPQGGVMTLPTQ